MTERTEVPIAEVREAVARLALASAGPVSADPQFCGNVAREVNMSRDAGDYIARRHWNRFCGQVQRSLAHHAGAGLLVKGTGAYGIVYRTKEQHAAFTAELASDEARRAARQAERERVYDELSLHGILIESERGREIKLDFAAWCVIIAALDGSGPHGRND